MRADVLAVWATHYYIAGRMAARARLIHAFGNLLHHAVEMYLKAALIGTVSLTELRAKYGHDIQKLWLRYKTKEADQSLDRFDATIRAVDKFEGIRYPDMVRHTAFMTSIIWRARYPTKSYRSKRSARYEIIVSDVDRLVVEILKRVPLNPKHLLDVIQRSGREALRYQNPHAVRWLRRRQSLITKN